MKVTYGPIVSSASGRFGGVVASNWKGIDLFRRFRAPSNPNTTLQQEVRVAFTNLNKMFVTMLTETKAAWNSFATGRAYTGRNQWLGRNVPLIMGDLNIDQSEGTPGDASTIPPVSMILTPAALQITVDITEPAIPTGWALTAAEACCIEDFDPTVIQSLSSLVWTEGEDVATPFSVALTGLVAASDYQVFGFLKWLAPDGTVRYSASLAGQATTP